MKFEYLLNDLTKIRRDLHQIPEIGLEEYQTSEYIKKMLDEMNVKYEQVAGTGILAKLKGDTSDNPICFRADMDGLPVKEDNTVDYKSNNGMMHACGHDGHMTMLIGLIKVLAKKNLKRDVLFLFQPGEENVGGAEKVLQDKNFQKHKIESIYGCHLDPSIEEGKIGINSGPLMAQDILFDIYINGKASHGAEPHKGIDAIYVASQIVSLYQSILSRNVEPVESGIITIGKIDGGNFRNQVAENVKLEGIVRTFKDEIYEKIRGRISQINKGIEESFDVKVKEDFYNYCPSVINDENLYNVFIKDFPKEKIFKVKPQMIAEDFGFYRSQIPSLFFLLGAKNDSKGFNISLHNSNFNFDEKILLNGVEAFYHIVEANNIIKEGVFYD
ncbi:MAG: M20 family metallopeptidase [Bacillota bacterium]|nr:M20 family metallopeptidase [Bacillota bacterium]